MAHLRCWITTTIQGLLPYTGKHHTRYTPLVKAFWSYFCQSVPWYGSGVPMAALESSVSFMVDQRGWVIVRRLHTCSLAILAPFVEGD